MQVPNAPPPRKAQVSFSFANGKVYASHIDLKRMARKMVIENVATNDDNALNMLARWMGEPNFQVLSRIAQAGNIATAPLDEIFASLSKLGMSEGEQFPDRLPSRFDAAWKEQAMLLMDAAASHCSPGKLDFVALAGGPGSGKTILANAHCHARGGYVFDPGLQLGMSMLKLSPKTATYFDQPAAVKTTPTSQAIWEWRDVPADQRTLKRAAAHFRSHHTLPFDDLDWVTTSSRARDLARSGLLVISFPDLEAVQRAIDTAWTVTKKNPDDAALLCWASAHVVNLDNMTTQVLTRTDR